MRVVVTGAGGFIGRNLCASLSLVEEVKVYPIYSSTKKLEITQMLKEADVVYHLAGVNRPTDPEDFEIGNAQFTREILEEIAKGENIPTFVLSSTIQVVNDSEYGRSKKVAEELVIDFASRGIIQAAIYRLPGVFGKWSKPNYNSVVSTFCYNIANGFPIEIREEDFKLSLIYVDDLVNLLLTHLTIKNHQSEFFDVAPLFEITLGELATTISSFPKLRKSLHAPKIGDPLHKRLYSTYLSYLPEDKFSYPLELKEDNRGNLFEWIKSDNFGQIFVSTTKPGITRGNHYHHLKTEKFLVIRGEAEIHFRQISTEKIIKYEVSGSKPMVVDIPIGYTHNITNKGKTELITLFWANEIFDSENPDTYFLQV